MDGDIQLERADGERAALTLFAAISTGASFTPVHEAEAGWIISSHVISRCNVRCRVFEIVCSGAFFSGVARLPCPTGRTNVCHFFFPSAVTDRLLDFANPFAIIRNIYIYGGK